MGLISRVSSRTYRNSKRNERMPEWMDDGDSALDPSQGFSMPEFLNPDKEKAPEKPKSKTDNPKSETKTPDSNQKSNPDQKTDSTARTLFEQTENNNKVQENNNINKNS